MKFNRNNIIPDVLRVMVFSILLIGSNADSAYSFFDFSKDKASHERIAQRPDPNEDRLLPAGPELPTSLPEQPEVTPTEPVLPQEPDPDASDQTEVSVESIEVTGNTVLDEADIAAITSPLEGKTVTVAELTQAANAITQLYFARGYITSRAVLPEQTIADGTVRIEISEGSLEDIQVEGLSRLRSRYITSRLQRGTSTPLNANSLEEQLRLLSFDPLLENISGRLQPGETAGESVLSVEVEEADSWRVGASVDNYASPSLGSERLGVSLAYQNLSGWGDTLSTSYYRSTTGGSNVWDLGYRLPVNALDGALSLRVSMDDFEVTQGVLTGLSSGESERYEISFRQPLIRSLREEFALSLGFSYRDGDTFLEATPISNARADSNRTSVFKFGQDYTRRDPQGVWSVRSQFNLGTGLFDATNQAGDVVDGQFFSWLGQVQRVQSLGRDNLLLVSGDVQLASGGLLSSEQFSIGGGQSLRGYRQNVRSGDNGFRFSIEDRIVLDRDAESGANVIQLAPFFDVGAIWNAGDNPTPLGNQNFLAGAGLGFLYNPMESLSARIDYAFPLISIQDEGDNAQDEGFYFTVNYQY
jgi:hemolysin activation/secretion protein